MGNKFNAYYYQSTSPKKKLPANKLTSARQRRAFFAPSHPIGAARPSSVKRSAFGGAGLSMAYLKNKCYISN
jgi:hypothetical protein